MNKPYPDELYSYWHYAHAGATREAAIVDADGNLLTEQRMHNDGSDLVAPR